MGRMYVNRLGRGAYEYRAIGYQGRAAFDAPRWSDRPWIQRAGIVLLVLLLVWK